MRLCVIGVGHVGLVTAGSFAELGHDVVGVDDDPAKIAALDQGEVPFYEPDLDELLARHRHAGRLVFTGRHADGIRGADAVFICVGTPRREDGAPNLSYVQHAASAVARLADGPTVVVEKSTVPVRTGERIKQALTLQAQGRGGGLVHRVASNPEFLREGRAVADTLRPDRIVVGADDPRAHDVLAEVYAPLRAVHDCPYVATDVRTAELIKHASNAFLATKISFINAVARICELAGADVRTVADAMGHDRRIGRAFLDAGLGYGGSCFPKDVEAFVHIAADLGYDFGLLRETERVNREAKAWPLAQLRRLVWNLSDKDIAVLGLAFKPGTDDIRDAPAVDVVEQLRAEGAKVRVHDPVALGRVADRWPDVELCEKTEDALDGAHAAVVATEWDQYRAIAPARLVELLTYPVVVDARGVWDPEALAAAGLTVAAVGQPVVAVPGA